jgi:hypothetical protein
MDPLDGFVIGHVPDGVGPSVSDFAYEWADAAFTSRVWERQVDGGHQVDLQVIVLRGERLTDVAALRDFLTAYHERDPERWELAEFRHGEDPGFIAEGEAFWLARPGVGVDVRLRADRFGEHDLRATALGVRLAG